MRNLAALLVAALMAAGCGKPAPALAALPGPVAGADYFPLAAGSSWTYDAVQILGGGEPETLVRKYVVEEVEEGPDEGRAFTLDEAGRGLVNSITMIYGVRDGAVVTWSGTAGITRTEFRPPFVELPATIEPGAVWTWTGTSKGVSLSIESRLEGVENVAVPAGIWDCLRISRRLVNGGKLVHWYAKDVGLVKMEIERPSTGFAPASRETWALRTR